MSALIPAGLIRPKALAAFTAALALALSACASEEKDDDAYSSSVASNEEAIADAPEGTFTGEKATGAPVKIGVLSAEGGAVDQTDGRIAEETVAKYANENLGGLGGREIQLEVCTTKEEDPSTAIRCANELVQKGVVGVLAMGTGLGNSIVPIVTEAGIPYAAYSGNSVAEMTTPGSFLWSGGTPVIAGSMAEVAARDGAKKFTMYVIETGDVPAQMDALAKPIFAAAGVDLTITGIPIGVPDASPQVQAGLESNPDAVGIVGDATTCTSVLKALKTVGSEVQRYLIQPCADPAVAEAVPDAYTDSYLITTSATTGSDDEGKMYRAIMAKYAPDAAVDGTAPNGYQTLLGFIRLVNAGIGNNEVTPTNVTKAIQSAKDVPLPLGNGITMTCDGTFNPQMPAACSLGALFGKFENGTVTEFEVL